MCMCLCIQIKYTFQYVSCWLYIKGTGKACHNGTESSDLQI